jgi:ribosome-binding factor A
MKRREEGAGHRHARLQELLLEELRSLFSDDISDPALDDVEIVAVVLAVDYRHVRVHYTHAEDCEEALLRATPFLRRSLATALDLKIVPAIRFVREVLS